MAPNTKQTLFTPLEIAPFAQLKISPVEVAAAPSQEQAPINYWDWSSAADDTPTERDTYWNWSVNPHTAILSAESIEKNLVNLSPPLELTRSDSSSSLSYWAETVTEKDMESLSSKYWAKSTTPQDTTNSFWDNSRTDEYWAGY